jgi:phosphoglycolate phosphatase-like HAD superfamily hydrolase
VKRRLVLFDIDGTLLLSMGAGRRAILAALLEIGIDPLRPEGVRFDGKTDPQIVTELLAGAGDPAPDDPARVALVLDRYVACLERELGKPAHCTSLMPGVPELLDRIQGADGAVLGLLTGNVMRGAELKLRSARLDPGRFQVGAFGSDHADRNRLPAIARDRARRVFGRGLTGEEIVIVGDTPADVVCGAGIGARAIGVATGAYSVENLEAAGAYAAFPDLNSAEAVWEAVWA